LECGSVLKFSQLEVFSWRTKLIPRLAGPALKGAEPIWEQSDDICSLCFVCLKDYRGINGLAVTDVADLLSACKSARRALEDFSEPYGRLGKKDAAHFVRVLDEAIAKAESN
jgi:hypothetical protein